MTLDPPVQGGPSVITYVINDNNFTVSDSNVPALQTYVYTGVATDGKGRVFDYYEHGLNGTVTLYENAEDTGGFVLDLADLEGKTIYFENDSNTSIFGVRTFTAGGVSTGFAPTIGEYTGTYRLNGNKNAIVVDNGTVTTLFFSSQPDFNNLNAATVSVTVNGGSTSTWSDTQALPANLLNATISFENNNGFIGERSFTDTALAYNNGSLSAVYLYDASTGMLMIKTPTVRYDITLSAELVNMPISQSVLATGDTVWSGTTTWTVGVQ